MKLLFDFFPLILMFAAYKMFDIYVATGVGIAATIIQVVYLKSRNKPVKPMMWFGLGVIVVMGGLTIFLQNEMFVKWKPTIIFAVMALAIAISQFVFKKSPIAALFDNQITAPEALWKKFALAWIVFLLALAAINLYFAYYQSTDAWFAMKTFGDMGLMLVFIIAQMYWLYPYMPKDDEVDVSAVPAKVEAKDH
jgi:intracellular septation protein